MSKDITIKEHLDRVRKIGHKVLKKNGHYKRMAKLSADARREKASQK